MTACENHHACQKNHHDFHDLSTQFHPDKTGGEFAAEEQKQQFMRIQDAIDFVNKHSVSTMLAPIITHLPDIINELRKLVSVKPPKDEVDLRNEFRQATKRRFHCRTLVLSSLAMCG